MQLLAGHAAGWVLFFAGESYALVKLSVVNGWMRIGSKWVAPTLSQVARGTFNFQALERLLVGDEDTDSEVESEEEKRALRWPIGSDALPWPASRVMLTAMVGSPPSGL